MQDGQAVVVSRQRAKAHPPSKFEEAWLKWKGLDSLPADPSPPEEKPIQRRPRKQKQKKDGEGPDGDDLGHTYLGHTGLIKMGR